MSWLLLVVPRIRRVDASNFFSQSDLKGCHRLAPQAPQAPETKSPCPTGPGRRAVSSQGEANSRAGGSFCHVWWKNDRSPCSEGFLFEGVANFLTKGGKKTPVFEGD